MKLSENQQKHVKAFYGNLSVWLLASVPHLNPFQMLRHGVLPRWKAVDDWINSCPSQGEWGNCCHGGASDMLQKTHKLWLQKSLFITIYRKNNKTYLANIEDKHIFIDS